MPAYLHAYIHDYTDCHIEHRNYVKSFGTKWLRCTADTVCRKGRTHSNNENKSYPK